MRRNLRFTFKKLSNRSHKAGKYEKIICCDFKRAFIRNDFYIFCPSLDGRAVVAPEGAMPKGVFAKTVGYLPGDSISVTSLSAKKTVDILVIGSIDSSEGVAILLSPEAANNTFGRVLSRNVQIFGFDPSSRNSTSSDVNGGSVSTSGQVTISVNYRSRQVGPSNAYVNLCKTQSYSNTEYASGIASNITYFTGVGDARMYGTAPIVETKEGGRDENENRYIMKSAVPSSVDGSGLAHGASFKHFRSIYRVRQVWYS